jgi:hypothetical protein
MDGQHGARDAMHLGPYVFFIYLFTSSILFKYGYIDPLTRKRVRVLGKGEQMVTRTRTRPTRTRLPGGFTEPVLCTKANSPPATTYNDQGAWVRAQF